MIHKENLWVHVPFLFPMIIHFLQKQFWWMPHPPDTKRTGPAFPIPTLLRSFFLCFQRKRRISYRKSAVFHCQGRSGHYQSTYLHTETSQSAAPLSYYTVGVDGISFSFRDQKEFQIFNCRKINTDLLFYFHSLFQELDEKKEGYEEICRHTLSILIAQLRRITDSGFQLVPSFHPSKECAQVKRYLDSNYGEDINLDQLAALSHLNKYYLSHEFTRYYGISPINYLNRRRIEVCKILLGKYRSWYFWHCPSCRLFFPELSGAEFSEILRYDCYGVQTKQAWINRDIISGGFFEETLPVTSHILVKMPKIVEDTGEKLYNWL